MPSPMFGKQDEKRVMGTEEANAITIQELMDSKDLKSKTMSDLNDEEIGVLALLQCIGEELGLDSIKDFNTHFCQFRVSRSRMGRREMKDIVTMAGSVGDDMRRRKSIKDLFGGMKA